VRRAQAIVVVLTLLALPLAPLAWSASCEATVSPAMCCLMHKMHTASGKPVICQCPGRSPQPTVEFTMLAPIPPGTASARTEIAAPQNTRLDLVALSQPTISGFRSAPFEPPRA
jgi:hypothetical protein